MHVYTDFILINFCGSAVVTYTTVVAHGMFSLLSLFVEEFNAPLENFVTHKETSPLPVKGFKF